MKNEPTFLGFLVLLVILAFIVFLSGFGCGRATVESLYRQQIEQRDTLIRHLYNYNIR